MHMIAGLNNSLVRGFGPEKDRFGCEVVAVTSSRSISAQHSTPITASSVNLICHPSKPPVYICQLCVWSTLVSSVCGLHQLLQLTCVLFTIYTAISTQTPAMTCHSTGTASGLSAVDTPPII